MEVEQHQEQRFRFPVLHTTGAHDHPRWAEVSIVGVRPSTFNTATFLRRQISSEDEDDEDEAEVDLRALRPHSADVRGRPGGPPDAADEEADLRKDDGSGVERKTTKERKKEALFCVTSHVVWRTSELMARWLGCRGTTLFRLMMAKRMITRMPRSERRLRVLELGCGLGLAGLACAKACAAVRECSSSSTSSSASSSSDERPEAPLIVMTDGDAAALHLLEHNLDRNFGDERDGRPHSARLVWGDRQSMHQLKNSYGGLPFDVILGADIIYHRTDFDALVDTIGFFMSEAEPEESDTPTRWKAASTDALVAIAMQERQYGARDQLVQTMRERLGMVARVLDEDEGGYWVGGNDYMMVFHHPRASLDLALLGPEMASDGQEDEEQLLLSISPPS